MGLFQTLIWILAIALIVVLIPTIIFWKKTSLSRKLKEISERKRMEKEVMQEARLQALREIKPDLVNLYKQKEMERLSKRKNIFHTLSEEFKLGDANKKIGNMLGKNTEEKDGRIVDSRIIEKHYYHSPKQVRPTSHPSHPRPERPTSLNSGYPQKMNNFEDKMRDLLR